MKLYSFIVPLLFIALAGSAYVVHDKAVALCPDKAEQCYNKAVQEIWSERQPLDVSKLNK